jgi:hypothetical protein
LDRPILQWLILINPQDPNNPAQKIGISVEDVTAFIALVKEDAGIQHEDEMVQAFNKLSEQVHPLALGNVKRSISQSRMMARKLLALHMDAAKDGQRIADIVDSLTSKLYYHGHPIHRREAKEEIGLSTIEYPDAELEKLMWSLYSDYEKETKMEEPFQTALEFVADFPNAQPGQIEFSNQKTAKLAYIESTGRTDVFSLDYQLSGVQQQNGSASVTLILRRQGWTTE